MRPYWPASKPRFWYPSEEARKTFRSAGDYRGKTVPFEGSPLSDYFSQADGIRGVARHKPGGLVARTSHVVGDLYPAASDFSLDRLDADGELPAEIKVKPKKSYADVTIDPKLKGFAYCDRVQGINGVSSSIGNSVPAMNRINGDPISDDALTWHPFGFDYAFERDEYVFFYKAYPLVNIVFGGCDALRRASIGKKRARQLSGDLCRAATMAERQAHLRAGPIGAGGWSHWSTDRTEGSPWLS
jgi:hypothetical protein